MGELQTSHSLACGKLIDTKKPVLRNQYTWQQVAQKNSENEAWIIVRNKVYDVTGTVVLRRR